MRVITVAMPKGGVGKSALAAELVAALAAGGSRVLGIDLDQQGNLTARLGLTGAAEVAGTTADALAGEMGLADAATPSPVIDGADALAGTHALAGVEAAPPDDITTALRDMLAAPGAGPWDAVVIDTPPAIGPLALAGLAAASAIVTPVTPTVEAFDQLDRLEAVLAARLRRRINPRARIDFVVPSMVDPRTISAPTRGRLLDRDVLDQLRRLHGERVTAPIREAVAVRDAYLEALPTSLYAPDSAVAGDYRAATTTIITATEQDGARP